jgi:hypothetical protein
MTAAKVHGNKREYEGPFEGEEYKEKDGLILDTGCFCAILKDENTGPAQETIQLSNLAGHPFLIEPCVPPEALLKKIPGVTEECVEIGGNIFDTTTLAKLLYVIGKWDVEFYKTDNYELLGIKACDKAYFINKPDEQRTTRKGVIAPKKVTSSEIQPTDEETFKMEIPTLQEKLRFYYDGTQIKLQFSLRLYGQDEVAVLKLQPPFSLRNWRRSKKKQEIESPQASESTT